MAEPSEGRLTQAMAALTQMRSQPFTYRLEREADRNSPLVQLLARSNLKLTDTVLSQAENLVEARKIIDTHMQPLVEKLKDTSISLTERWAAYEALVKGDVVVDVEPYGNGFIEDLGNFTLYDDFYMERHEEREYLDILDTVREHEDAPDEETINNWKEKVLAKGCASFCYDW